MMNCYFSAYPSSILLEALGTFGVGCKDSWVVSVQDPGYRTLHPREARFIAEFS